MWWNTSRQLLYLRINADGCCFGHGIGVDNHIVGLGAYFFAGRVVLDHYFAFVAGGYSIVRIVWDGAATGHISLTDEQRMGAGVLKMEGMPYSAALGYRTKVILGLIKLHGGLEHIVQFLGAGAGFLRVYLAMVAAAILAIQLGIGRTVGPQQ